MADIKCMWIDTLQSSRTNPERIKLDIAYIIGCMLGKNSTRTWIPPIMPCQWFDKKLKRLTDLRLDYIRVSLEPELCNWSLAYEKEDNTVQDIVCVSSKLDTATIVDLMCTALCNAYVNGILETEEDE